MRLIDADAFSAFIKKTVHEQGYDGDGALRICDALTIEDVLNSVCAELDGTALEGFKNAPTVDAATMKRGRWIKHNTGHSIYYSCSLCDYIAPYTETADKILWKIANFCPNCGANMKKDGNYQ